MNFSDCKNFLLIGIGIEMEIGIGIDLLILRFYTLCLVFFVKERGIFHKRLAIRI